MAIYRIHDNLHVADDRMLRQGSLARLDFLPEAAITRLEARETISRIKSPPLAVLPGWVLRGQILESCGITDIEQLLEADVTWLGATLDKPPELIEKWQAEATLWLMPEKKLDGCSCRGKYD